MQAQDTKTNPAGAQTWFTIITDDGEEHKTLLDRGTKAEVFSTLDEYVPSSVRVLEQNRDDEFAETLQSLNGEEWLRNSVCPVCHRMDFDAVLEESLTSNIGIKIMEVRLLNAKEAAGLL